MQITHYALMPANNIDTDKYIPLLTRKEALTAMLATSEGERKNIAVYKLTAEPSLETDFAAYAKARTSTLFEELDLPRNSKDAFTKVILESYDSIRKLDLKTTGTLSGIGALAALRFISTRALLTLALGAKAAEFGYKNREPLKNYFSDLANGTKGAALRNEMDDTISVSPTWLTKPANAEHLGSAHSVLSTWQNGQSTPQGRRPRAFKIDK